MKKKTQRTKSASRAGSSQITRINSVFGCGVFALSTDGDKVLIAADGKRVSMPRSTFNLLVRKYQSPQAVKQRENKQSLGCHASRDGDCRWRKCPQTKDGEPNKSGRHCPLDFDIYCATSRWAGRGLA